LPGIGHRRSERVRRESRGKAWLRATVQRSVGLGFTRRGAGEGAADTPLPLRRRRRRIDEDDQLTRLPAWRGCCLYAIQEQWRCSSGIVVCTSSATEVYSTCRFGSGWRSPKASRSASSRVHACGRT